MNDLKHILITGATGYIGGNLAQKLSTNFNVHALVREIPREPLEGVFYYRLDGAQSIHSVFKTAPIDTVIHLASKAQYDWNENNISEYISANIELGSLILEVMPKYGCLKFINTSTYWQEFSEAQQLPICYYAATKAAFEKIVDFFCFDKKISAVSLRLHDVYGPNDPRPKIFSLLKKAAEKKEALEMTAGEQEIYLTHVEDVVEAYKVALKFLETSEKGLHSHYDVRGQASTLQTAVKKYLEVNALTVQIKWGSMNYRKNQIIKPVLLPMLPNWSSVINFKKGFKDL